MTKQMGDDLICGTRKLDIWPPLPLPQGHNNIVQLPYSGFSSICMRGYFAEWTIDTGLLWLTNLSGRYQLLAPTPAEWVSKTIDVLRNSEPYFVSTRNFRFQKVHKIIIENGQFIVEEQYVWDSRDQVKRGWPPE